MQNQIGQREKILSTIRRAIQIPAPKPHSSDHTPVFENTFSILGQPNSPTRDWLPPVGEDFSSWVELFAANSADLRTEFLRAPNRDELRHQLLRLKSENAWTRVGIHAAPLLDFAREVLELPVVCTDEKYDPQALEKCEVGLTTCQALVAQTGSILMTNRTEGGRVLSILPPHHVVLATPEQMLPDLPAAFELLEARFGQNYPSLMGLITGPSRTGDIERILVLGAHGPRKLTVILVENE